jgi:hypothetical protein
MLVKDIITRKGYFVGEQRSVTRTMSPVPRRSTQILIPAAGPAGEPLANNLQRATHQYPAGEQLAAHQYPSGEPLTNTLQVSHSPIPCR